MSAEPTVNRDVLPSNVIPLHYELSFEPNFDTFKFEGSVKINLQVNDKSNDVISLNTLEIEYHSAKIGSVEATNIDVDDESQIAKIHFPQGTMAKHDQVDLEIKFTGLLNDKMAGFYRAKYQDKMTGETKYMATTQMEATDARRAFPCFDEPNLKATFGITLISEPKYTHLSNMDVKFEEVKANKKATTFNTTPKMSTYLVAFVVSELKYVENNDFRIPIKVYATPGDEANGQFAADLTAKTLAFFEKTFNIEYPLPKMDKVAIHEFSAGAMENWGLVTYRVIDVLLDEKNSSLDRIQRVAEVVQHELAHQWFGNLVTMDWWEGLWLNEGFATWMSWYACNNFQPGWKVWEQYVADNLQRALSLDSLRSSHPIEVPVKSADEINQIFDAISYSKGSSLLRMISIWLGEETFIKGVSNYLKKFKYTNAKTEDLWDALAATSGKDVRKVMNIWTKQVGFPVVTVEESGKNITFSQQRFLSTNDVKPEEDETVYPVFLALKTKNGVDNSIVLDEKTKTVNMEDTDFLKVNGNQAGVYITSYSDERWAKFGQQRELLSVEDRTGLVADVKNLSSSGFTSTTNFLNLVSQWKDETSFVVWQQITNSIAALKSSWIFEGDNVKNALNEFTRKLVSEKIHKLGWSFEESDSYETQRLKVTLFGAACAARDEVTEKAATEMFSKYTNGDKTVIPALLRQIVFNTVARIGGQEAYEKLFNIYKNPTNGDEKLAALKSLGIFKDAALIERTIGYLLDGTILNQDIYTPMVGLRSHKEGINALWAWLQKNWTEIVDRLQPGSPVLGHVLNLSTSGFTSVHAIDEINKFFGDKSTKGFDSNIAQSIDTIKAKTQWVNRDGKVVEAYLKEHGYMN
ncbi:hypothetical protein KAFR_0J00470 [Kazachstania africana CBS 2517]|uniref:Aminopeptidase n=1 Tax=Kazachstania africana (strain ATCC 22294 / BCRC 22015 / CBS 2517 / CECT 1963 / NBRC 1671 / NRRL Y-8276) TaxID=1071382 RepID=H2B0G5_KAZAF|nr:hypothetical protein KAFR_0J00470 [Kazachstania africana CBS 2517]CCF60115.1 hypothetical protein KAFR_0J00470 [Kazachstania africana CBS 2517]